MKRCPYCREKIKRGAIICKHCNKDLSSKEAKIKQKEISKRNSKIFLFLISLFLFLILPKNPILSGLIILLIIWIFPRKEEAFFRNRLKNWKDYKLRLFLSAFIIIFAFSGYNLQKEEGKRIKEVERQKKEQEKIVKEYPEPKIIILSGKENQGKNKEYLLEFSTENSEEVLVNGEEIEENNGKFEKLVKLENPETTIRILAKNRYKQDSEVLSINRNEIEEEKIAREKRHEEQAEKEKVAKKEAEEARIKAEEAKLKQEKEEKAKEQEKIDNFNKEKMSGVSLLKIKSALIGYKWEKGTQMVDSGYDNNIGSYNLGNNGMPIFQVVGIDDEVSSANVTFIPSAEDLEKNQKMIIHINWFLSAIDREITEKDFLEDEIIKMGDQITKTSEEYENTVVIGNKKVKYNFHPSLGMGSITVEKNI